MNDGATRSRLIRDSLRAFVCGLLGLIPFLGIPAAICGLVFWIKALKRSRRTWNPAAAYLHCGVAFAMLGLLLTLGCAAIITYAIYNANAESSSYTDS